MFASREWTARRIIEEITLEVGSAEVVALVGESGSGKTTAALALLGYARRGARIVTGRVTIAEQEMLGRPAAIREGCATIGQLRATGPRNRTQPAIADRRSDRSHAQGAHPERHSGAVGVRGLGPGSACPIHAGFVRRYPHQLSGGQQQRVAIAIRARLPATPGRADEPTTALDVVTQARILDEIVRLRDEFALAMVYVSHDLSVVAHVADRIGSDVRGPHRRVRPDRGAAPQRSPPLHTGAARIRPRPSRSTATPRHSGDGTGRVRSARRLSLRATLRAPRPDLPQLMPQSSKSQARTPVRCHEWRLGGQPSQPALAIADTLA